eukprot:Seg2955.3 transcript_id=Seg2955.3/GoldUCD/mRNA.D3Y31 product="putative RNA-directed DNA polymerase from transposon X-element" protein_id=Seg2955.3/GoldUCD/D3Y31
MVNRRNVVCDVSKNVDACKKFLLMELTARIVVCYLQVLGIDDINDQPADEKLGADILRNSKAVKRKYLHDLLSKVVDSYLVQKDHMEMRLQKQSVQESTITSKPLYNKGDYDKIRGEFKRIEWEKELEGNDAKEMFSNTKLKIEESVLKHVPISKGKSGGQRKPLWMNSKCLTKIRQKHQAYKRYLNTKEGRDYMEYTKVRNQAKSRKVKKVVIRKVKKEFEQEIARNSKVNPKSFYKYVNSKSKTLSGIPNLMKEDGTTTQNDQEKADELNTFFASVFTKENLADLPLFGARHNDVILEDIDINEQDVDEILANLNPGKSPGPDGIHPRLLKESRNELKKPLTILYRKCIEEGALPSEWKEAHVTPIYKKGKKEKSNNYRPVSLTSIVCKGLEKIVRKHCVTHLKRFITTCQHGFVEGRSCLTQLLNTIDIWTKLLDDGIPVDAVYLDFAKAFDSVPHRRLLIKLESYGIKGKILSFISDFITGRQRVVVNGSFSNWASFESGIPQGSVLGPLLFMIYINNMPETVDCMIRLFADHANIFTGCRSEQERETLQQDLISLQEWSN